MMQRFIGCENTFNKPSRSFLWAAILLAVSLFAGCSALNEQPALTQSSAPKAQAIATTAPTATTAAIEGAEVVDWLQVAGKEGDLYVLGNPNAPIRLIDYSDFL